MLDTKDIIKVKPDKRQRRKTIPDECITLEQYKTILGRICECIALDEEELCQKNIIRIAMNYNLSNNMIAEIINYLLPEAKATKGSVASMIKFMRNQSSKLNGYAKLLQGGDNLNER